MSSKKPFDYIEDKIKQAAENSLPAFDEKAWQVMEAKLDGDDKKRRPLFWWFLLPLLIAGAGIVYYNFNKDSAKDNVVVSSVKNTSKQANEKNISATTTNVASTTNDEKVSQKNNINETVVENKIENITPKQDMISDDSKIPSASSGGIVKTKKTSFRKKGKLSAKNSSGEIETFEEGSTKADKKDGKKNDLNTLVIQGSEVVENTQEEIVTEEVTDVVKEEVKENEKLAQDKKADADTEEQKPAAVKKEKEKTKKKNGFYVLAAGGADAGSTKLFSFSNSSVTPKYGIGIGYQLNKRWSLQTGLYAANKKFVAGSKDYTLKPGSPMAGYEIKKINASCLVYEIPLTVKYDIISKPSVIFYATAGMSSYIIKKEKYNCFYNYYNTTYQQAWEFSGNRNLFSMANFSIGIEKKISPYFSLLAEPSLSIPVSGVGDGKVKLYSTSLQVGLKYYLFKKQ